MPILSTGLVQHALESYFKYHQRERKTKIASVTQMRFPVLLANIPGFFDITLSTRICNSTNSINVQK
jgi:hypothetical protein